MIVEEEVAISLAIYNSLIPLVYDSAPKTPWSASLTTTNHPSADGFQVDATMITGKLPIVKLDILVDAGRAVGFDFPENVSVSRPTCGFPGTRPMNCLILDVRIRCSAAHADRKRDFTLLTDATGR